MRLKDVLSHCNRCLRVVCAAAVAVQLSFGGFAVSSVQAQENGDNKTKTPIKHVIVIIGENRSFDHVFIRNTSGGTSTPRPTALPSAISWIC